MAQNFNCGEFRIQKSVVFKSRRIYVSILSLEKHQKPERLASLLRSAELFSLFFERFFWICFIVVHILRPVKNIPGPTIFCTVDKKRAFLVILFCFNSQRIAVE